MMRNTKQIICADANFVKKRRVEIWTKHKDDKKLFHRNKEVKKLLESYRNNQ